MHLRLKILTEIAISPILIGANGAPLQGGVKKKVSPNCKKKKSFPRLIPSRGESIEFDTLIIFPLVLQVKKFQNLGKSMSKFGLRGSPHLPLTLIRLGGVYCMIFWT